VTHYDAYLGVFKLRIEVFHTEESAPMLDCSKIGTGSYGAIYQQSKSSKKFVVKLQERFDFNRKEIEFCVKEIAIHKVMSALGVGPKVETDIPFDVIYYNRHAQFHL
jgi:hypothetical protein